MKITKIFEVMCSLLQPVVTDYELYENFDVWIAHNTFEDEDFDVEHTAK